MALSVDAFYAVVVVFNRTGEPNRTGPKPDTDRPTTDRRVNNPLWLNIASGHKILLYGGLIGLCTFTSLAVEGSSPGGGVRLGNAYRSTVSAYGRLVSRVMVTAAPETIIIFLFLGVFVLLKIDDVVKAPCDPFLRHCYGDGGCLAVRE